VFFDVRSQSIRVVVSVSVFLRSVLDVSEVAVVRRSPFPNADTVECVILSDEERPEIAGPATVDRDLARS